MGIILKISRLNIRKIVNLYNLVILIALILVSGCSTDNALDNDNDSYQDMLTPDYYNSENNDSFRSEENNFIEQVRKEEFHHPLENSSGQIPAFTVPSIGEFGAGRERANRNIFTPRSG